MPKSPANNHIAILMATYNGENYLEDQLDSIASQSHSNFTLYVSDDGSSDSTLDILHIYQQQWGKDKLHVLSGPQKGSFSANFLSLLCNSDIDADYYAVCDQDDIWLPNKLSHSLKQLGSITGPGLYFARTIYIDSQGEQIGLSPLFTRPPSFDNALMQSIGGGNTMLLNAKAIKQLRSFGQPEIVSHDWWSYIVITGVGGEIIYDSTPTVLYRQHGNNIIGSNTGFIARLKRISMLFKGRFRSWSEIHISALESNQQALTDNNQQKFEEFKQIHHSSNLLTRVRVFANSGLRRQTTPGNVALLLAVLLKRV